MSRITSHTIKINRTNQCDTKARLGFVYEESIGYGCALTHKRFFRSKFLSPTNFFTNSELIVSVSIYFYLHPWKTSVWASTYVHQCGRFAIEGPSSDNVSCLGRLANMFGNIYLGDNIVCN